MRSFLCFFFVFFCFLMFFMFFFYFFYVLIFFLTIACLLLVWPTAIVLSIEGGVSIGEGSRSGHFMTI